jgi:hypothetical protein
MTTNLDQLEFAVANLGTHGGDSNNAYGLNPAGEVVGFAATPHNAIIHSFFHSAG